ncbi:hypothetical protein PIB30_033519 [Stylosanthes scabra]|uniref:3-beta hydroxysteroid dehydrogenase/isomerase domain-containing protein n=1 Tax=Stylosanthes scabra TaxID=79078 RepID=A0ABU6RCQ2_9FABA|nr:hypothetical protein [Stylosanthes scabra]
MVVFGRDTRDINFLTNLPGASQNLQILSADLSNPVSSNAAIEGCIGVFHVVIQMDFELQEPEVVTKRTIDGALGILKACLNSNAVKRLIYTSSSSAVLYHNSSGKDDSSEEVVLNEDFWSDVNYLRASMVDGWSYSVSKTLTEKAVLDRGVSVLISAAINLDWGSHAQQLPRGGEFLTHVSLVMENHALRKFYGSQECIHGWG